MADVSTALLGLYLAVCAWAKFSGSHIPVERWGQLPYLINSGIRSAAYILWPHSAYQSEDLRRLRQDAGQLGLGFDTLLLRFGWERGVRPPPAADFIALFKEKVLYAKSLGYKRLMVLFANEPNLELDSVMTPAVFLAWYQDMVQLWRADPDLSLIPIVSPNLAGYAPNSWAWWDGGLRDCCTLSDYAGLSIYPSNEAELQGGWSLPWWQGQVGDKPIVIVEMGARTDTPAATRAALLPKLYAQAKACPQVACALAFVQWTEGAEHAEHWLTAGDYRALIDANLGTVAPPVLPPVIPPTEPPAIPIGGRAVYRVTVERIE